MTKEEYIDELWVRAQNSMRRREYEAAKTYLRRILRLDRANAAAHNRLGIVYAKEGAKRRAYWQMRTANKMEPSAASEHNLGLILYELKRFGESKKHLLKALAADPYPPASRYIALAKVAEKLEEKPEVMKYLRLAYEVEPMRQTKALYLDAYKNYSSTKKLSSELILAMEHNKSSWTLDSVDDYAVMLDSLQLLHSALEALVHHRPLRSLSLRSKNTKILTVAYLHNMGAITTLLNKGYSLASSSIARSMFEIYLRVGYGMTSRSNRKYAALERNDVISKHHANTRIMRHMDPLSEDFLVKTTENRKLSGIRRYLERRYVALGNETHLSFRQMALLLDGNVAGKNYALFERLYEKGSDTLHANGATLSEAIELSGTKQVVLFNDSYVLLKLMVRLTLKLGMLYKGLPEITSIARRKYENDIREIAQSIRNGRS